VADQGLALQLPDVGVILLMVGVGRRTPQIAVR
jgi:predicted Kef-type K+ transport protein